MATYDMDKKQEIVDYYISNGLKATAEKFNMTEEELMDNFYGIGQSERGDSQGGYSDKNWEKESQSFIRDMIKTLLPGKTANASEGKSEGGMFSSAEKYAKNFSDNMSDVGKFIRDLVPSVRMTEGNTEMTDSIDNGVGTIAVKKEKEKPMKDFDEFGPKDEMTQAEVDEPVDAGKIDGYDFNEFGRISEDGTLEAEKEDTSADEYIEVKGRPEVVNTIDLTKEEEPKVEKQIAEPQEESPFGPGYHKLPGQNFWTVNEKDPFWKTEEGGVAAEKTWGSRPSWVKQKEVEEFDFDGLLGRLGFK